MIQYRELCPDLWPALVTLFGESGACGGCWCQWWRVERGGRLWEETKGERARDRMKEIVTSGKAFGILAFDGEVPVGWCSFGPRSDFPRIETVKAYRRDDTEGVWCINCFFIVRGHRGKGIARGLLGASVEAIHKRGVKTIEAYPVTITHDGNRLPPVFSWTGPLKIFEEMGFKEVQRIVPTKPVVRLTL
jgi:GNAT superfamily N-acetyltransferase